MDQTKLKCGLNEYWYWIEYNGKIYRCYDESKAGPRQMFYCETVHRFELLQNIGYSYYVIYGESNKKNYLSLEDINFLNNTYTFDQYSGDFDLSENIKKLQKNKHIDLDYLCKIKNIEFVYFVLKKTDDNFVFYDLILGFKKNINIEELLKDFNSTIINLKYIVPLNQIKLSYEFIQSFFNIENTIFKNVNLSDWQSKSWYDFDKVKNTIEKIEYSNHMSVLFNYDKKSNVPFDYEAHKLKEVYLEKKLDKKRNEATNLNSYKTSYFESLCTNIIYFNLNYDETFLEDKKQWYIKPEFEVFTNYFELIGAVTIKSFSPIKIAHEPCWYPYDDIVSYNINHDRNCALFIWRQHLNKIEFKLV